MTPASRRTLLKASGLAAAGIGTTALTGCSSPEEKVTEGPTSIKAADVPVGSGKIIEGTNFVVTQPTAGNYCAFTRLCHHAACNVTQVEKGYECGIGLENFQDIQQGDVIETFEVEERLREL